MEFGFDLERFLYNGINIIGNNLIPVGFEEKNEDPRLCALAIEEIIDKMGVASAAAQGLSVPVTSGEKMKASDHTLFLMVDIITKPKSNGCVIGMLKVGKKDLYLYDKTGKLHEGKQLLCALDFYVHESKQHCGYGTQLFNFMLRHNKVSAEKVPIDRPSQKFLKFAAKNYKLKKALPQSNNFMVFEEFFNSEKCNSSRRRYSFSFSKNN